ncbi:uncharacterized protein M6B38_313570 [Iris pallida]|uniref:HTH OST-type domain-containing protein n=1 Tax=Iris pallida TaxID=29817 RepID=A0AAX6HGT4_IRIPA|nr:uncharacterized protein M6B38_313570 [Iris pallida]
MSYEDKAIPSRSPSPKTPPQGSPCPGRSITFNADAAESPQTPIQQIEGLQGPVAILWDMENCPVPSDVRPEDVAGNIRLALRVHPTINGAVTLFSAYGDFNAFPRRLREGCQRTGVKLVDVPNGRKDAADKAILVDMFLFALDNRPPSSILLISGDVDFAPALHILGQRGYTIVLVIPSGVGVSSALTNAGRFVWDWPSVARGEDFVPPRTYLPRGPDTGSSYSMSCNFGNSQEIPNEEEAIVYRGVSHSSQIYCYNLVSQYSSNNLPPGPNISSSRSQSLPCSTNEGPACDPNGLQDCWTQPGDLQGLKGQLVRLLNVFGGSLPLVRVPTEYLKNFGRPLYMAEYGVYKLVNLIKKMEDTLVVMGKGTKRQLCLRSDRSMKNCPSPPPRASKDKSGKDICEESGDIGICRNLDSCSDDFSDEERSGEYDERLDSFKQEVQELLVCCSCAVPLANFESLYNQRYKKALDFQSFGVDGLVELLEKVRDVVALHEEQGSKRKFLLSSCVG